MNLKKKLSCHVFTFLL